MIRIIRKTSAHCTRRPKELKQLAPVTAEPDTRAFSMSDPHEIRLRLWHDIADRLEAEINRRRRKSRKSTEAVGNSVQPSRTPDPEVAKRRSIVKSNSTKSAAELCKLFDYHNVLTLASWEAEASVKGWAEAYRNRKLRPSIQSLITRDKKASAKSE